jgi:hypothetical protein
MDGDGGDVGLVDHQPQPAVADDGGRIVRRLSLARPGQQGQGKGALAFPRARRRRGLAGPLNVARHDVAGHAVLLKLALVGVGRPGHAERKAFDLDHLRDVPQGHRFKPVRHASGLSY